MYAYVATVDLTEPPTGAWGAKAFITQVFENMGAGSYRSPGLSIWSTYQSERPIPKASDVVIMVALLENDIGFNPFEEITDLNKSLLFYLAKIKTNYTHTTVVDTLRQQVFDRPLFIHGAPTGFEIEAGDEWLTPWRCSSSS